MTLRPQYHFRPSPQGVLIWNVRNLVFALENAPVVNVQLSDIAELDEPYWFGATGDVPTCRHIAAHMKQIEECDLSFPIILCAEGRIMDGMHRVVRALNLEHETICAKQFQVTPKWDFVDVPAADLPY